MKETYDYITLWILCIIIFVLGFISLGYDFIKEKLNGDVI